MEINRRVGSTNQAKNGPLSVISTLLNSLRSFWRCVACIFSPLKVCIYVYRFSSLFWGRGEAAWIIYKWENPYIWNLQRNICFRAVTLYTKLLPRINIYSQVTTRPKNMGFLKWKQACKDATFFQMEHYVNYRVVLALSSIFLKLILNVL